MLSSFPPNLTLQTSPLLAKEKGRTNVLVSLFLLLSIYAQIVRIVAHKSKLFKYKIQINSPDFYYLSL